VATIMPGPYRMPVYRAHLRVVITNKAPLAVYRGVGHPVAILVMEALLDEAARRLGLDPGELRRRNLINPDEPPFTSVTGHVYDSGSHQGSLRLLLRDIAPEGLAERKEQARARGTLLGVGLACFVEVTAPGVAFYGARGAPITAHDQVEVRMEADGPVTVLLGTPGQGQGLHTTAAQVVADHLGVPFERITVLSGDTKTVPHGTGVWASRSAVVSSGAAASAAHQVRRVPGWTWARSPRWPTGAPRSYRPSRGSGCPSWASTSARTSPSTTARTRRWWRSTRTAASDLPDIHITHIETPSPITALGVKGAGEAGAAGAPAAVHNAVNDALAQRGARVWHQPITPERVLRALDEAAGRPWPEPADDPALPTREETT